MKPDSICRPRRGRNVRNEEWSALLYEKSESQREELFILPALSLVPHLAQRTLPSYHEQTIQHKNRKLLEVFFFLRMKDLTVMIFRDSKDTAASDREFLKSLL